MFDVGFPELLLILVVALIVFGPGRLPEIGAAVGRAIREFRQASAGLTQELLRPEAGKTIAPKSEENREGPSGIGPR